MSPSYGMVTSAMVTFPSGCHRTKSGRRSPGTFLTFCSGNLSPSASGIAFERRFRMALCRSRMRPAFGVHAFST